MIVVSDSSPLISLAAVGELALLRGLFGGVLVPSRVWDEVVQADRPGAEQILRVEWIRKIGVANDSYLLALETEVDPGEAEAIALAAEIQADAILLDERRARSLAISMGFEVIGTRVCRCHRPRKSPGWCRDSPRRARPPTPTPAWRRRKACGGSGAGHRDVAQARPAVKVARLVVPPLEGH